MTQRLTSGKNPLANNSVGIYNGLMSMVDPDKADQYQKFAESFFNSVDVEECKAKNNTIPPDQQLVLYAMEGLKAGLHPSELSTDELQALYDTVGDVWIKKFGFKKEEVPPPPLVRDTPPLFTEESVNAERRAELEAKRGERQLTRKEKRELRK